MPVATLCAKIASVDTQSNDSLGQKYEMRGSKSLSLERNIYQKRGKIIVMQSNN